MDLGTEKTSIPVISFCLFSPEEELKFSDTVEELRAKRDDLIKARRQEWRAKNEASLRERQQAKLKTLSPEVTFSPQLLFAKPGKWLLSFGLVYQDLAL